MGWFKEFRELAAWRLAHQMNLRVEVFLGCPEFRQHFKSCRQLSDAARSGPRNIAEGCASLKHKDFARCVRKAQVFETEVLNHLIDAHEQRLISTDELLINRLLAKRALRAARGLIRYLESTPDQDPLLPKQRQVQRGTLVARRPRIDGAQVREAGGRHLSDDH